MESLVVHPENKDQLKALKAFLKALNIGFERKKEDSPYDSEFVKKIKCSDEDIAAGRVHRVDLDDIWK